VLATEPRPGRPPSAGRQGRSSPRGPLASRLERGRNTAPLSRRRSASSRPPRVQQPAFRCSGSSGPVAVNLPSAMTPTVAYLQSLPGGQGHPVVRSPEVPWRVTEHVIDDVRQELTAVADRTPGPWSIQPSTLPTVGVGAVVGPGREVGADRPPDVTLGVDGICRRRPKKRALPQAGHRQPGEGWLRTDLQAGAPGPATNPG